MNNFEKNTSQFCLGISKPLNILDKNTLQLINYSLEKNFYVHTSLSYPVNFFFIKYFLTKKKRNRINFICKILADTEENFKKSIHLTLKKFGIKKIHIVQLINLPISGEGLRNNMNLDNNEFFKIITLIDNYKKKGIIDKVYLQILSTDSLEFCKLFIKCLDGFAFYANLKEIQIKKEVFELIKDKNIPSIILSVFGNPDINKIEKNLHIDAFKFSQSFFSKNTIAVGRTLKISRLKEIINIESSNKENFSPSFTETDEKQDTAHNFYRRYKVTTFIYIIIFMTKCLVKRIITNKILNYFKKQNLF